MAKIIPISEHFQHFLAEMKESFWGDLYGQTKLAWQRFFELQSERQRDRYSGWGRYERRRGRRRVYRNGYYERDFVTRFGTIRLRVARTREKSFLPRGLQPFQRDLLRPPLKRLQTTGQKALLASTRNPQPDGAEAGHKIPLVVAVAIDSPSATPPFVPPPARIAIALPLRLQLEKPLPG